MTLAIDLSERQLDSRDIACGPELLGDPFRSKHMPPRPQQVATRVSCEFLEWASFRFGRHPHQSDRHDRKREDPEDRVRDPLGQKRPQSPEHDSVSCKDAELSGGKAGDDPVGHVDVGWNLESQAAAAFVAADLAADFARTQARDPAPAIAAFNAQNGIL